MDVFWALASSSARELEANMLIAELGSSPVCSQCLYAEQVNKTYFRLPTLLWVFTSRNLWEVILSEGCLHSSLTVVIYKAKKQIHL